MTSDQESLPLEAVSKIQASQPARTLRRFVRITFCEAQETVGGSEGWAALEEPQDIRLIDGYIELGDRDGRNVPLRYNIVDGQLHRVELGGNPFEVVGDI